MHLWSTKTPLKDVVYSLATTYKILDLLAGVPAVVEGKEGDVGLIGAEIVDSRDMIEKVMSICDLCDAELRATHDQDRGPTLHKSIARQDHL